MKARHALLASVLMAASAGRVVRAAEAGASSATKPGAGATYDAATATTATTATPSPSPTQVDTPAETRIDPRLLGEAAPAPSGNALLLSPGTASFAAPVVAPAPRLSRGRAWEMIAMPAGALTLGGASWAGMANQTGDAGTPALEMGAGYAGSWIATAGVGLSIWALDGDAFRPAAIRRFSDAPWTLGLSGALVPLGAGAATFAAGEGLEGGSRHPWESFGASVGGAAAGELLTAGVSALLRTPQAPGPVMLAFVPVAAGSALGYRVARGRFGREKALVHAPFVVLSARF